MKSGHFRKRCLTKREQYTKTFFFIDALRQGLDVPKVQCDQIGRFIAIWATFQSLR